MSTDAEQMDRISLEIGRKIMSDLELSMSSVEDAILIAGNGKMDMLRAHLETMVERSLILGQKHGIEAYSAWQYFTSKNKGKDGN